MQHQIIFTTDAPAPIGPYSQAVRLHHTLYVSGQIALHPQTGNMMQEDIQQETRQVMENVCAILRAAGTSTSQIVKTSIFLLDMTDFAAVNEVYASYFKSHAPARETIQVARLPKDARVEISVIAYCPDSP
jgi:2-iminobutanoate/2-iminopropanoate deaminase